MKKILTVLSIASVSLLFGQNCNYKTLNQNGVLVKQFNPMPIGGNIVLQIATSISNINGNNNLMITFRFLGSRLTISNQIKITFSNSQSITLSADRQGNDYIGGSDITHLVFSLTSEQEEKLSKYSISSLTYNNTNTILAKMNKSYISQNLNCFN